MPISFSTNEIVTAAKMNRLTPGYGTTLPASPTDGDTYILVDSTSNPTYQWMFLYHSGSANTDKWEFIGGVPANVEVTTQENTSSTTYAALATAGPLFAIPRAGVYDVYLEAGMVAITAAQTTWMSYDIGGTAAVDADAAAGASGAADPTFAARTRRKTLTAVTLTAKYRVSGNTGSFQRRVMRVCPVRVS